jgi:phosphate:Na+ symporter
VVGVAVLLPLMGPFTRLIERLVPERGSAFTKYLDPAALRAPTVAVEAVRRTVERALETLCLATAKALAGAVEGGTVRPAIDEGTLAQASDAVRQAGGFLSKADPPPSDEGHAWYTSTVHALDHATRLAEAVDAMAKTGLTTDGPEELSAAVICARSMREAAGAAVGLARSAGPGHAADDELASPAITLAKDAAVAAANLGDNAVASLERDAAALADFKVAHRRSTLETVASGGLTASAAIARVDAVALLNRLAHHAWRAVAHLERAAATPMELEQ